MAGLLGNQTQQRQGQEDDFIFEPMRAFDLEEMPKGLLNDFEGGPITASYVLTDYGDQDLYGIQLAVRVKFRTSDGDESEETYPAGDLRYFRPATAGATSPVPLPPGYYDDKVKKYFIPDLKGASREQLDAYAGDQCFARILSKPGEPPRQAIFSENKKFGELLKHAKLNGWPYDKDLLFASVSRALQTMYGQWNRINTSKSSSVQVAEGGLLADGASEKKQKRGTLLLTQYIPPPPTWGSANVGAPSAGAGVPGIQLPNLVPSIITPPQMPQPQTLAMSVPAPTAPTAAGDLLALVPQLITLSLAQKPIGQPIPLTVIASDLMAAAGKSGIDPATAWLTISNDLNRVAMWAQQYGWGWDAAAKTFTRLS